LGDLAAENALETGKEGLHFARAALDWRVGTFQSAAQQLQCQLVGLEAGDAAADQPFPARMLGRGQTHEAISWASYQKQLWWSALQPALRLGHHLTDIEPNPPK